MLNLVGGRYDCTRLAGFLRLRTRPLLYFLLLVAFFLLLFSVCGAVHMPFITVNWVKPLESCICPWSTVHSGGPGQKEAPLLSWPVSWSKFKAAPALKGPDGVLRILPSGSIIFVLWTAALVHCPSPCCFAWISTCFSYFWINTHFLLFSAIVDF